MPTILRRLALIPSVVLITMTIGAPLPALALDMTGTWEGKFSCKDVTSGAATKSKGAVTMTVTQVGNEIRAAVARAGRPSRTYLGHLQELLEKPDQGAITLVSSVTQAGGSGFAEILNGVVKVKPGDPLKATFKATSGYEDAGNAQVGGVCRDVLVRSNPDPLLEAIALSIIRTYVISAIDLPMDASEATALGFDLDGIPGDGIDNALGAALGSFAALVPSLDLQASITQQVDQGTLVQLAAIKATDLAYSGVAGLSLYAGTTDMTPPACLSSADVVCRQQFGGTGSFVIDPAGPRDAKLLGAIQGGQFIGGPGQVTLQISLRGVPMRFVGGNYFAEFTPSAVGAGTGKIGGAISQTELQGNVLPALAPLVRMPFDTDCDVGGTPPSCGCAPGSTGASLRDLFDVAPTQDCVISDSEVTTVLSGFLTPDLDLDGNGVKEAVSVGLGFQAVAGSFTVPH